MTPVLKSEKPVATRSALLTGVIGKGAVMPPYFNLLLIISSILCLTLEFFVQIIHRRYSNFLG